MTLRKIARQRQAPARAGESALASRIVFDAADVLAEPRPILAEPLRELAEKVSKDGKDGNLTVGPLRVTDHKIDVMIYLKNTAPETLEALKKLGFHQSGQSKAIHLLIGSIDVRRLEELAELDVVIHVAALERR